MALFSTSLITFLIIVLCHSCLGEKSLSAKYLSATLPQFSSLLASFYDGNDSIYLLGGGNPLASTAHFLVFSISTGKLQRGAELPDIAYSGTLQGDSRGQIYYLGGGQNCSKVFKYDPKKEVTSVISTLPYNLAGHSSIKKRATSDMVYIFGGVGQGREILALDLSTGNFANHANLSYIPEFFIGKKTAVLIQNSSVFLFDAFSLTVQNHAWPSPPEYNKIGLELDLDSGATKVVGSTTLPTEISLEGGNQVSGVADGRFAYILGGYVAYYDNKGGGGIIDHPHGIIRFDPVTLENRFVVVDDLRVGGQSYFQYAPSSVYVPKLKRIYFFGGTRYNDTLGRLEECREIFYIDLTPLE